MDKPIQKTLPHPIYPPPSPPPSLHSFYLEFVIVLYSIKKKTWKLTFFVFFVLFFKKFPSYSFSPATNCFSLGIIVSPFPLAPDFFDIMLEWYIWTSPIVTEKMCYCFEVHPIEKSNNKKKQWRLYQAMNISIVSTLGNCFYLEFSFRNFGKDGRKKKKKKVLPCSVLI